MTSTCFHCRQPGIDSMAKRWSSRARPVECSHCGKLSHVLASTSSGITMAGLLIVTVSAIAAGVWHMAPLVLVGLCLAVANNIRAWKRAKMVPISKEGSAGARKEGWFVSGVLVLISLS